MSPLSALLIGIALSTCVPSGITAQVIRANTPANPEIDYGRLKRIDTLIDGYVNKDQLAGVVMLIVKDGQLIQYKGYGYLDREANIPMPNDAIFRIMSQTKAITSAGIMILYEQGKLTLDEPIADFIPEYSNQKVLDKFNSADTTYTVAPAKRAVTFRDLLTHTSGLDYPDIGTDTGMAIYAKAGIPSGLGYFNTSLLEKMKALAKLPLLFQPGEKWQYGLNTDLLGCLIEVISGKNLEEFLHENIFVPLGMNDTYFNVPESKRGRLASVYTEDSLHHIIRWSHDFRHIDPDYPVMKKSYFSGGAGLSSTAFDYAKFLQMMLNGGVYNGRRILSPRTVKMMTSGQLDFNLEDSNNFGLGFEITSQRSAARNPRSEGSFGWAGYFGTFYWADPKEKLVTLIMTQQTPNSHDEFEQKIESLVYAVLNPPHLPQR